MPALARTSTAFSPPASASLATAVKIILYGQPLTTLEAARDAASFDAIVDAELSIE
ncbi:MAG: hypothetical protein ACREHD_03365 [Pirellulales bacterium]